MSEDAARAEARLAAQKTVAPSPEALIQRLRREASTRTLPGEYLAALALHSVLMQDAADALASSQEALRAAERARDEEERAHLETIDQRDRAEDAADRLAYAIAPMEEIGEHSNLNDPWQNALDALGNQQSALQAKEQEIARLTDAIKSIVETFRHDEADGYRSRDRKFAIDVLGAALASSGAETP